ncbi:hypothetical protein [Paenibacillus sp. 1001270B_150601_E10]|uniref:hypothetical protein n=1 Tax=Paenibacillus sp. 1001270B_150601_E10 TaxID=2787079 RepID=UPI00189F4219|nr:hypothetical protein [Paenibacillus sp. 1001270B_150601_E10]
MKKLSVKQWMGYLGLASVVVLLIVWAPSYYGKKIFFIDNVKYSKQSEASNVITYASSAWYGHKVLTVENGTEGKKVILGGEDYLVQQRQSVSKASAADDYESEIQYEVTYPNGKVYRVENLSGNLIAYDEKEQWYSHMVVYSGSERLLQPGEEYYHPIEFVRAAFEQYHDRNGTVPFLVLAIAAFAWGYAIFRFEAFRELLFKISYGLWIDNGEPSELYHYSSMGGGLLIMGLGVWIFFQSL